MRISVLGSGSSGNCTLVSTARTNLLFDAGFGSRALTRRLRELAVAPAQLHGIVLSHGHADHVSGAGQLSRHFGIPIHLNEGTYQEVPALQNLDRLEFFDGKAVTVGDISFTAFPVPHDAAQPVAFRVTAEGVTGVLATDLGWITPTVRQTLRGCQWMILESNHDEHLLRVGPYPWHVKQRVLSNIGHLSNSAVADFLRADFDGSADHLFLAHISRRNNHPELAVDSARAVLDARGLETEIHLTSQHHPTPLLDL